MRPVEPGAVAKAIVVRKIRWPKGRAGSIPAPGTIAMEFTLHNIHYAHKRIARCGSRISHVSERISRDRAISCRGSRYRTLAGTDPEVTGYPGSLRAGLPVSSLDGVSVRELRCPRNAPGDHLDALG